MLETVEFSVIRASIILVFFMQYVAWSHSELHESQLVQLAQSVSESMLQIFKNATGYEELKSRFLDLERSGDVSITESNGEELGKRYTNDIHSVLMEKTDALFRVKNRTEELAKVYEYEPDIHPFNYYRDSAVDAAVLTEVYPKFSQTTSVNLSRSFVQVPTNVYAESKPLLNFAKWSEGLDEVFVSNYNVSDTLLWQYVGSSLGPFRSFPGHQKYVAPGSHDLYDCRRRIWYIQSSASPKDFLILLDNSGTMTGMNFDIARIAIKSLINTFQENDFFNVMYVDHKVHQLKPCFTNLIQATKGNKEMMMALVDTIPNPRGTVDMALGIHEAFKIFALRSIRNSSMCNRAIAIISDGLADSDIDDALDEENSNRTVRVFTYMVGRHKNFQDSLMKRVACENRGYFYQLETLGSVWDVILDYLTVMSRPLAFYSQNDSPTYTHVYLDADNLGMMISVAMPAFDQHPDRKGNLIGVAGIDVAMSLLISQGKREYYGVGGYGMVINNNGLVIIHPDFRDQKGYLPNPATLFLNQIVYSVNSSDSVRLMRRMIDRETGSMTFPVYKFVFSSFGRWLHVVNMSYFFYPIPHTPFSAAVAMETERSAYASFSNATFKKYSERGLEALTSTENNTDIKVANWNYCNIRAAQQDDIPAVLKAYPTAAELQAYLNVDEIPGNCDVTLVRGLLISAVIITDVSNKSWSENYMNRHCIDRIYAVSGFGYMKTYSSTNSATKSKLSRDFQTADFYKHAEKYASDKNQILVFTVSVTDDHHAYEFSDRTISKSDHSVTVSTPITYSEQNLTAAIMSMDINVEVLENLLSTDRQDGLQDSVLTVTEVLDSFSCDPNGQHECYLLDENGYVVASTARKVMPGTFYGSVNGPLLRHLLEPGIAIFRESLFDDYQGECLPIKMTATSSSAAFKSILYTSFHSAIQMIKVFLFLTSDLLFHTSPADAAASARIAPRNNVSCVKTIPIYRISNSTASGNFTNRLCTQYYAIVPVPHTNLALLVTENPPNRTCSRVPALYATPYLRLSDNTCHEQITYRQALPTCHFYHPDTSTKCSNGGRTFDSPIYLQIILLLLILFSL